MHEFSVKSPSREALLDITGDVENALGTLNASGEVLVHISIPHTTAGVTVNEGADPSVAQDIVETLAELVPRRGSYRHGEGNADAHIKTALIGSQLSVPARDGRLRLGTWQAVFLAEFDGPRTRKVWVQVTEAAGSRG